MPHFANDLETETLAREAIKALLDASSNCATDGKFTVPTSDRSVFLVAYGWWKLVCRTSKLIVDATKLTDEYTVEIAPLVRNVFNYAFALNWLVDNGEPGIAAVIERGDDERRKAIRRMREHGWNGAEDAMRQLEDFETHHPAPELSEEEAERANRLRNEVDNTFLMFERYGSADIYPVYSHLSAMSHPSIDMAYAYLAELPDGNYAVREVAEGIGYAYVIQTALSLLQATEIMSSLMHGDPMRSAIDEVVASLSLEGEDLLPKRTR